VTAGPTSGARSQRVTIGGGPVRLEQGHVIASNGLVHESTGLRLRRAPEE